LSSFSGSGKTIEKREEWGGGDENGGLNEFFVHRKKRSQNPLTARRKYAILPESKQTSENDRFDREAAFAEAREVNEQGDAGW